MKIIISEHNDNKLSRNLMMFKINESIMKDHFKQLMRISVSYNKEDKTGFYNIRDEKRFLELVNEIENTSAEECQKSHVKSILKKIKKRKNENAISFQDYCEDYLDMHSDLMTPEQRKKAMQGFIRK